MGLELRLKSNAIGYFRKLGPEKGYFGNHIPIKFRNRRETLVSFFSLTPSLSVLFLCFGSYSKYQFLFVPLVLVDFIGCGYAKVRCGLHLAPTNEP